MVDSLLLTAQERERFASWLEHELETSKGMVQQMEKMGGMQTFIDKMRREMMGYLIVAQILRSTEDMTI